MQIVWSGEEDMGMPLLTKALCSDEHVVQREKLK